MTVVGRRRTGFTLVEVLVALAVMSLLAVMSWRGLDAMGRVQVQTQARADDVLALQSGLAQWGADLDASTRIPPAGGVDFDGQVLRMTRHYPFDENDSSSALGGGSIRVIAWGARVVDDRRLWLRWQSAPLRSRADLLAAWQQAALWGQNPTADLRQREVSIAAVDEWQVFFFRNNSWTSALSSAAGGVAIGASAQAPLPDGVRLVLTLSDAQALSGKLTRDWVRPTLGRGPT